MLQAFFDQEISRQPAGIAAEYDPG